MMINVGRLKSGDVAYVRDEICAVVEAIAPVPLKVILKLPILPTTRLSRLARSWSPRAQLSSRPEPDGHREARPWSASA